MTTKMGERAFIPVLVITITITFAFLAVPGFPLAHAQNAQKAAVAGAAAGAAISIFKTYWCRTSLRFGRSWGWHRFGVCRRRLV